MPMPSHQHAANAYSSAAETVSPALKIVMLYDGAISRLHEAKLAILEGRIEDRYRLVLRATAIIDGLHSSLDHENGGHIATLLDRVYGYASLRLQQINVANDPEICDEITARLSELRESWAALAHEKGPLEPSRPRNSDQHLAMSSVI